MFDFLYNLPDAGVAALLGAVGALAFGLAPFVRKLILRKETSSEQSEAANSALGAITAFVGVLLAFSFVEAQGNLNGVSAKIDQEASDLNQFDRLLLRYGDPKSLALRDTLHDYEKSIVNDEWQVMQDGKTSPKTEELYTQVSRGVLGWSPEPGHQTFIYPEILKTLDSLAQDRSARLATTETRLPKIYWQVILTVMVAGVLVASMVQANMAKALALAGQGLGLALLLALVIIYDEPYKGETAVSSSPISQVLTESQARQL